MWRCAPSRADGQAEGVSPVESLLSAVIAGAVTLIGVLIANSFNLSKYGIDWCGFTLGWYVKLFASASLMEAGQHSLSLAPLTAPAAARVRGG